MSAPLFERLHRLRVRIVQLLSLYGISWTVAVLLVATLSAGLADWLIHFDDPGIRLIFSLSILGLVGWTSWKFLWKPIRRPLSDIELALRIEQRYPGFSDGLASTVQFLHSTEVNDGKLDSRLGSPSLQQKIIGETLRQIERVNLGDVLETRQVKRAALTALLVCLVTATIVATNLSAATLALERLAFPFSASEWPRKSNLRLLNEKLDPLEFDAEDPLRLPVGGTLELFVENTNGLLPEDLKSEIRVAEGTVKAEKIRRTTVRDNSGVSRELAVLTIPSLRQPVHFRAVGGDDSRMPFFRVEVVPPPILEELQVEIVPPAYSQRSPEKLQPGAGDLTGLVGTRVKVHARVNKPLRQALLRVKDHPATPMSLSDDGLSFQAEFALTEAGAYSYWFDLRDRQGFENPNAPRYEIRATADLPPDVTIETPSTDLRVTASAVVPFRIVARDDLYLNTVRMTARLNERTDSANQSVSLFPTAESGKAASQHQVCNHQLSVAEFGPTAGDRIHLHGEATDGFDLGPVHIGRSIPRVLTVVTEEEKSNEIASRQSTLVDELDRTVEGLRKARENVGQLELQLSKAGELKPGDFDLLKRVELDQKQLSSRIAGPVDSLASKADELIQELKQNGLSDEASENRLKNLAESAASLRERTLPKIEQDLTLVRKSLEQRRSASNTSLDRPGKSTDQPNRNPTTSPRNEGEKPDSDDARSLKNVGEQQEEAIDELTAQLNQLAEWRSRRDVASDLTEVIHAQNQLREDSGAVGRRTLGKTSEELSPQDHADLVRLADRQSRLSERTAQFRDKLTELAKDLDDTNPDTADALRTLQDELRKDAVAERMREAADQLERNQTGKATSTQQDLLNELNEMKSSMTEQRPSDLETLAKRFKNEELELEKLERKTELLQKKMKSVSEATDSVEKREELLQLKKELEEAEKEVVETLKRLRKLQPAKAAESMKRAAERLEQAGNTLEKRPADAEKAVEESLDDLKQARRELAQERQQIEEQLAQEQLEKIADELRSLIPRQKNVIEETERLQKEFLERGNWSRGQLKTLLGLSETQITLQAETAKLSARIEAAEVFALALKGAARLMELAGRRLSERKTDAGTLDAERAALRRLESLIAVLREDPNSENPNNQKPESGEQPEPAENDPQNGPPTDGIPQLAQLKLLKSLQEELLLRTTVLDEMREKIGDWTPELQQELDAVALEQGQLADLARNLIRRLTPATNSGSPEEGPEKKSESDSKPADPKPNSSPSAGSGGVHGKSVS